MECAAIRSKSYYFAMNGCLNNKIWNNNNLRTETKVKIQKSYIRPVLTYGCECRTETQKIKQINETTEMKVLRKITGKSLRDKIRSTVIREECKIEPINLWINDRRLN